MKTKWAPRVWGWVDGVRGRCTVHRRGNWKKWRGPLRPNPLDKNFLGKNCVSMGPPGKLCLRKLHGRECLGLKYERDTERACMEKKILLGIRAAVLG